jgi:hypothetical protein
MPTFAISGATGLLLLALAPMPYGFYTLLRHIAAAAVMTSQRRQQSLPWLFGFLALLFNPIVKIPLSREVWTVVDFGSAVLLLAAKRSLTQRA